MKKRPLFDPFRAFLLAILLFAVNAAHGQTAYERLYWMGYNPGDLESIYVNGTGRVVNYSSGHSSFAIEVDVPNQKIYWYDLDADAIMRCDLNGANPTVFLAGIIDAQGLSIDFANQKLFWASTSSLSIESINLNGTGRTTVVPTASAGQPESIKVDVTNQKIYWFDHNSYSMKRANTNGTNVETFISYTGGNVWQIDIDEPNSKLYFPSMGSNTIESINLDGTGRTTLVSGFSNVGWPMALTVDKVNGKIYWWDGDMYTIRRANLNGTGVQTFLTDIYSVAAMMVPTERIPPAPVITAQPSASTICAGANTSFSVTATNATSYQWEVNTGSGYTAIANTGVYSNATTATLTITGATAAMNGYLYRAVVTGSSSVTSNGVALTVNAAPSITLQPAAASVCDGGTASFNATAANATGYQWQVNTGSGYVNITNGVGASGETYSGATTTTLTATNLAATMSGYTYRNVATGICAPAATSNDALLTVLANVVYYQDADGDSYGNLAVTTVSCTGAPVGYVSNSTDCDDTDANINPGVLEICYDGIDNNCDGNIDENCTPLTQIASASCGTTITYVALDIIQADPVAGATAYEFRITDGAFSATATSATPTIRISDFTGYNYGQTYQVAVRAQAGGNWAIFHTECPISIIAQPETEVEAAQCATTLAFINSDIYTYYVPNVTYRFRVTNGANVQTLDKAVRTFNLTELGSYAYNTPYTVDVALFYNGSWTPFGPSCVITSPLQQTQVQPSQCGSTLASVATAIYASNLSAATQYRFRVTNGATVQIIDRPTRSFALNQLASYAYATTYTIDVAVEVSGSFGTFGPACSVTTPPAPTTQVQPSQCGITLAAIGTAIYANSISGATQYRFRVTNGANVQTIDRATRSFAISQLGTYAYGTTYSVEVAVEINGSFGAYGAACNVTTPTVTSKVQASQCGITLATASTAIYADNVSGATQYRFRVTNGANVQTIDRPTRTFAITQLSSYSTLTTYTIEVAVEINGSFGPYGTACNVTTPSITTKIQASQCGITLAAVGTPVYADNVAGATKYRFRVTNGSSVQTIDRLVRSFAINQLATYYNGTTYTVDVAVEINGSWEPYGTACNVTTPGYTTHVQASQCGTTLATPATTIYADNVASATQYRFRVKDGSNVQTIDVPTNSFNLTQLGSYSNGTTYTIDVAVQVNGTWEPYGAPCQVTTPGSTTQVQASQCGTTLATLGTLIYADNISSATQYRFRVTDGSNVQTIDRPSNSFSLTQLGSYANGVTYSIDVAVQINGTWEPYGTACNVSAPSILTQVQTSQCGTTLATIGTAIYANNISSATQYRFRVTNGANVQTIDRPTRSFGLTQLTNYAYNTTYTIDVALLINGVWNAYGPACSVSTPVDPITQLEAAYCGVTVASFTTPIYAVATVGADQYRFEVTNLTTSAVYTVDKVARSFALSDIPVTAFTTYSVRVAIKHQNTWRPYGTACNVTTGASILVNGNATAHGHKTAQADAPAFDAVAYPNPFQAGFSIAVTTSGEDMISVTVFDMAGKMVESRNISAEAIGNEIMGESYASGIYQVHISQGSESKTLKVVKH